MYIQKKGLSMFSKSSIVQEHQEEKNPGDELLMVDLRNSSNLQYVNSWSDYNRYANLPLCTN